MISNNQKVLNLTKTNYIIWLTFFYQVRSILITAGVMDIATGDRTHPKPPAWAARGLPQMYEYAKRLHQDSVQPQLRVIWILEGRLGKGTGSPHLSSTAEATN
jgi:hypothetical protein